MIEAAEQALETLAQRNARVAQRQFAHAPQAPETSTATQRDDTSTLETPDLPAKAEEHHPQLLADHTSLSHGLSPVQSNTNPNTNAVVQIE
jgi:hypothetical protein